MHDFLPLERVASHAPRNHRSKGCWELRNPEPHSAAAARGFPAEPGGYCAGVGHRSESAPCSCGASLRGPDERIAAAISWRPAARWFRTLGAAALDMMSRIVLVLIRVYQLLISPALPSSCRFYPTCSAYAYEAVETWGLRRGIWLAVGRIAHCHPFTAGGYDPVPQRH